MSDFLKQFKTRFEQCQFSAARNRKTSIKTQMQQLADALGEDELSDVYGTGELIESFEQEVAELLGKEAAVFMPSGTMAQPIALRIWADQTGSDYVALHGTSHLQLHEHNSYQLLYGLKGVTLGQSHKVPVLADLEAAATDPLAAILLELPMREIGGQLPEWEELVDQSLWARERNIRLHMDGARLWQCPAYYGKSLSEISELFDSVYVSFYKDLGGISGAILAGDQAFIDSARVWLRRAGGNLYALYPYVVAARQGLAKHLPEIPARREQAIWLADQLNQLPGVSTWPRKPQTNMFRLRVMAEPETFLQRATQWMQRHGIALVTAPYLVAEDHLMCELSIGDAFAQLSPEHWQQHIDSFATEVLGYQA